MITKCHPVMNNPVSNAMSTFMDQQQADPAFTLMTVKGCSPAWTVYDLKIMKGGEDDLFTLRIHWPVLLDGHLGIKVLHNENVVIREFACQTSQLGQDWNNILRQRAITRHYQHLLIRDSTVNGPSYAEPHSTSNIDQPKGLLCSNRLKK